MFDMISDVPVNYTVVIALSIVVCIMAAALISKRIAMKIKGPLFNPVLQHLNSEMDSNTAALDKRNARHEQMEKFASKISKRSTASTVKERQRDSLSPALQDSPSTPPTPTLSSSASSVSTARIVKRLFHGKETDHTHKHLPSSASSTGSASTSTSDRFSKSPPGCGGGGGSAAALKEESVHHPHLLIGCRIFVSGRGQGTVTGMLKRKFHSTTFRVLFDREVGGGSRSDGLGEEGIRLKRGAGKAGEDFQILPSHS